MTTATANLTDTPTDSKGRTIAYWATTGLLALALAAGGIMDLTLAPELAASLEGLGYPLYLAAILGVWKLLGAAAIVAPKMPIVKEWAYAGITFDLTGAVASHALVGDPIGKILPPLLLLALAAASYLLRPEARRLR
jgi:hypothetical protein